MVIFQQRIINGIYKNRLNLKQLIMSGDPIPMQYRIKRIYTLNEAIDLMEMYHRYPTGHAWNWIDVHTRQPIAIGSTK